MGRKSKKSNSQNCGGNIAKKKVVAQLEWGDIFSGVLRGLTNFSAAWRMYEVVKSFLEQNNLFS